METVEASRAASRSEARSAAYDSVLALRSSVTFLASADLSAGGGGAVSVSIIVPATFLVRT